LEDKYGKHVTLLLHQGSHLQISRLVVYEGLAGEIFKLQIGGHNGNFVSSQALLDELNNEKRFTEAIPGALKQLRNGVEDSLFTAYQGEHNWTVANRVLLPALDPRPDPWQASLGLGDVANGQIFIDFEKW
jgi:hypothetical protein